MLGERVTERRLSADQAGHLKSCRLCHGRILGISDQGGIVMVRFPMCGRWCPETEDDAIMRARHSGDRDRLT
jgi:hypothetical protein